jgi:alkylation response protein AidB-like acyl-CoA dehydrogenase
MQGSFIDALDYCRQRMQGGREIVNWSEVRMLLSSMAVAGKVADMLVERAAQAVDRGEAGWQLASRATALQVQRMATQETSNGIQLFGGYGYMKDYGQEKRFRDAQQIQVLMGITPVLRLKYIRRIIDGELPW